MAETKLYRHFDASGALLYVGISLSAISRLQQHNGAAHWASQIASMTIETHPTRAAAEAAEQDAIRTENPLHNIRRYAEKGRAPKVSPDYVEIPHITIKDGREVRHTMKIPTAQWEAALAASRSRRNSTGSAPRSRQEAKQAEHRRKNLAFLQHLRTFIEEASPDHDGGAHVTVPREHYRLAENVFRAAGVVSGHGGYSIVTSMESDADSVRMSVLRRLPPPDDLFTNEMRRELGSLIDQLMPNAQELEQSE